MVLMDMRMPVMDGYTATGEIRKWEQDNEKDPVPIIALTANALVEDRQKCLDAGCTDYLAKPIKKGVLLKKNVKIFSISSDVNSLSASDVCLQGRYRSHAPASVFSAQL